MLSHLCFGRRVWDLSPTGLVLKLYQRIDHTIVQLFISQASVVMIRVAHNSIGIFTTRATVVMQPHALRAHQSQAIP